MTIADGAPPESATGSGGVPGLPPSWSRAIGTPGGYLWWYFDALTPEGDGLCCIFFVGSVFSPSYAVRLRHGEPALPTEHCAVNLALYRGGRKIGWVLSEYEQLAGLDESGLTVGTSAIERAGASLRITLAERSSPFRTPVVGQIDVEPLGPAWPECAIGDAPGARHAPHGWQAVSPRARVRARFARPAFELEALGYHDVNYGEGRLEDAFSRWGWARFHGDGETAVVFAFTERGGGERSLLLRGHDGPGGAPIPVEEEAAEAGPSRALFWGLRLPASFGVGRPERLRCEAGTLLEAAPFYARFQSRLVEPGAPPLLGLGEYLDLDSFRHPVKQFLLRYLMRPVFREPLL